MNGESLLGARHKRAVDIIRSLHDSILFLICDGYSYSDISQSVSSKVNQGQDFGSQETGQGHRPQSEGHEMVTEKVSRSQGLVVQGREVVQYQSQEFRSQGHTMVTEESSQGQGPQIQGHEMVTEKVSRVQGHELLQCQGHEVMVDKVGEGQGLVFEGHVKVNGMSEPTVDEHHRERARQRRLARY